MVYALRATFLRSLEMDSTETIIADFESQHRVEDIQNIHLTSDVGCRRFRNIISRLLLRHVDVYT